MKPVELYCPMCDVTVHFEQPPCRDKHGEQCAEWCCTQCGDAILIAPVTPLRRRMVTPPIRRAA